MGSLWSDFFGPPSEDRAERDVKEGSAEPRNSGEEQAASDYFDEYVETGNDPLDPSSDSSDSK